MRWGIRASGEIGIKASSDIGIRATGEIGIRASGYIGARACGNTLVIKLFTGFVQIKIFRNFKANALIKIWM